MAFRSKVTVASQIKAPSPSPTSVERFRPQTNIRLFNNALIAAPALSFMVPSK